MRTLPAILPVLWLLSGAAAADEGHEHRHPAGPERLGKVNFPVSCSAAARKEFQRGVALLHSFWYERAEKTFSGIAATDPTCGMAHWGVAMSLYHPIWAPPSPEELTRGLAAVEKAKATGARTARERDYMAAIEAFYKDAGTLDHGTRKLSYEKAMEEVHRKHPKDREAAIFYTLALLGTAPPADKTYANSKKAAAILNGLLPQMPEHPGIAHYLIHSFDYPQLAELALPAARAYSKIAESSPHALHMPSHIFTRLGLWEESIRSNLASAAAAKAYAAQAHPGATAFDDLHAMDYLAYAYLQGAEDAKAKSVAGEAAKVEALDLPNFAAAYALAAVHARQALERRQWSEAAGLTLRPASFPWLKYPYAEAIVHFARGIGGARGGDLAAARSAHERLDAIRKALVERKDEYWAGQVEIQRLAVAGWIAQAEGKSVEAVALLRAAASLEDSTEKHPVTPGSILPSRELLADLHLELGQAAEALEEYQASLRTAPARFNSFYGAAKAAELKGDREKARAFYQKLESLCARADGARPELAAMRSFLVRKD